jgi:hypothetical protein
MAQAGLTIVAAHFRMRQGSFCTGLVKGTTAGPRAAMRPVHALSVHRDAIIVGWGVQPTFFWILWQIYLL